MPNTVTKTFLIEMDGETDDRITVHNYTKKFNLDFWETVDEWRKDDEEFHDFVYRTLREKGWNITLNYEEITVLNVFT